MKPRANVLGLIQKDNQLLLEEKYGRHSKGEGVYYRPIGGTIEFGESSCEALKREFFEELAMEIDIKHYVTCIENIFEINTVIGHEITQVYEAAFKDISLYQKENFRVVEGNQSTVAKWIFIKDLHEGRKLLFPEKLIDFL